MSATSNMINRPSMQSDNSNTNQNNKSVLNTLTFLTGLSVDPRPTFVVDTSNTADLYIAYLNPALNSNNDLLASLQNACQRDLEYSSWVVSANSQERYYRRGGVIWYGFLIDNRWKVVSSASQSPNSDNETDYRKRFSSSPIHSNPIGRTVTMTGEQHATYQATINQLEEEIRTLDFGKKLAERERTACQHSVQRLRDQLQQQLGVTTAPLPKSTSHSALHHLGQMDSLTNTTRPDVTRTMSSPLANTTDFSSNIPEDKDDMLPATTVLPSSLTSAGTSDSAMALEKFQRLAEMVDVGFFDYHPSGRLVHANESWYALSGHPRKPEAHTSSSFQKCVYPDDMDLVMRKWKILLEGHAVTFEMRWKKPSKPSADPIQASDAQWVLSACVPVIGDDGQVKSISGCTTDINSQKHSAEVALQRAEALERARASEERFSRFASVAPIAIFRFDKHRNIEYCNDRWFELTGLSKTRFEEIAFPFGILDEDIATCTNAWDAAIENRTIGEVEFRLRKTWHDLQRRGPTWVHATFFPEFSEDGHYLGLMGSMSNISHLKWAENMQKSRAEEALEAKRQQENFIDITSHELRNPLSAIVQCADSILSCMNDLAAASNHRPLDVSLNWKDCVDTALDAAQTILSCAAHQKRIVDDILTLSKLDSNLLLVTPIKTQPIQMVQEVLKMFEMDSRKADVNIAMKVHASFETLGTNWLTLDPSRVVQILINLLTNAIKFTRDEPVRKVTIRLSVHTQPPSKQHAGIEYIPAETITDDYGSGGERGEGEPVFLKIEVQDTGRGLNLEEKAKLFLRFSQASPKTHVQYGGSGLGLFISRKLTEMQGGEIGFSSEPEVGSTFAFYVKTRRTTVPIREENLFVTNIIPKPTKRYINDQSSERGKLHILLVEDNIVNQRVLKQQLQKVGCQVYLAGQGLEALDLLKTTDLWNGPDVSTGPSLPLDLVLMDIEMPIMGGLECTIEIRKLEQSGHLNRHLPIISISANARQEQVNEAKIAGVDETITKPFRIRELMPKIHMLVSS